MPPNPDTDIAHLLRFLHCATPDAWLDAAVGSLEVLLRDHANCEKKAAATALGLMQRYAEQPAMLQQLSRLAREELRHFEQVSALMRRRGIQAMAVTASRYAGGLRAHVRRNEPARLLDTLLVSAIIEARSCERFAALAPRLDHELSAFYSSLLASEARHFEIYLKMAGQVADAATLALRLPTLLAAEADLIRSYDTELRFHSGIPQTPALSRKDLKLNKQAIDL